MCSDKGKEAEKASHVSHVFLPVYKDVLYVFISLCTVCIKRNFACPDNNSLRYF